MSLQIFVFDCCKNCGLASFELSLATYKLVSVILILYESKDALCQSHKPGLGLELMEPLSSQPYI